MRKLSAAAQATNNRVKAALEDYRNKVYSSINAAALAHNVSEATLRHRVKGGKSRVEASEEKQVLFATEEKSLAQWIVDVSRNGYPPRKSQVREMAEDIGQQRR